VRVEPQTSRVFGPFTGVVEARYQTQLGFRTGGRIITRDAVVGDLVKKGQRLATLDPRLAQLAILSAQADLADAQALVVNAKGNEERKRALVKTGTGGASQAQLDSAVATLETAKAKLAQARASLAKAQEQASYTELVADYDSVISVWNAEIGQVVSASQAVVTVARPDIREAVFDVPDELMAKVPKGAAFTVALLIDPKITATGKVREIAPEADAATLTRRVKLALDTPPTAFRLGTNVTVSLAQQIQPSIFLPPAAVLSENGKDFVWIVTPEKTVSLKEVGIGERGAAAVKIDKGLSAGEIVVVAGAHSLKAGQAVGTSGLKQ
jgi:RND family efflux transporter MFP subunit